MGNSIRLFNIFGISIRMHITFPLILVWAAIQFGVMGSRGLEGALFGVVVTLLLFAIVVLHELGHSVAALRYGVPVKQIVLLPIGGVAQLSRIPEKPDQEFVIAIAGPLVNFVLAIVLAIVGAILGPLLGIQLTPSLRLDLSSFNLASVYQYVFVSNLFLGIFNLLPAFPMDGGRVLRALLATRLDYLRATSISVAIGQTLAWLLGLWGFLQGGFFLILIAIFIYLGAGQEEQLIRLRSVLGDLLVDQVYSRNPQILHPMSSLRDAVALTLSSFQANFPVCDGNRLIGMLTHARLVEALEKHGPDTPIAQVMQTGIAPVRRGDSVFAVQQRMSSERIDALPVAENGELLGLITTQDINEVFRLLSSQPNYFGLRRA